MGCRRLAWSRGSVIPPPPTWLLPPRRGRRLLLLLPQLPQHLLLARGGRALDHRRAALHARRRWRRARCCCGCCCSSGATLLLRTLLLLLLPSPLLLLRCFPLLLPLRALRGGGLRCGSWVLRHKRMLQQRWPVQALGRLLVQQALHETEGGRGGVAKGRGAGGGRRAATQSPPPPPTHHPYPTQPTSLPPRARLQERAKLFAHSLWEGDWLAHNLFDKRVYVGGVEGGLHGGWVVGLVGGWLVGWAGGLGHAEGRAWRRARSPHSPRPTPTPACMQKDPWLPLLPDPLIFTHALYRTCPTNSS